MHDAYAKIDTFVIEGLVKVIVNIITENFIE